MFGEKWYFFVRLRDLFFFARENVDWIMEKDLEWDLAVGDGI